MSELLSKIDRNRLPSHIAIIMDGNGRWAKSKGKNRVFGHKNGVKSVRQVVEASREVGVKYLTLYTFSTENWKRPKTEINALFDLLVLTIKEQLNDLHKNNVRVNIIGEVNNVPKTIMKEINKAIELTKNNDGLDLIMAFSYSSRWDIANAIKKIVTDSNNIEFDKIDENFLKSYLSTSNYPDPDLLIRTSGEFRISNFLLWELAYTELFFSEKYWPEFSKEDFYGAIIDYQQRERRFGKVSEQLI